MGNRKFHIDYILALPVFGLILIGVIMLASVSAVFSFEKFGTTGYYFVHQMLCGFLPGIILAVIAFFLPIDFFKKWSFFFIMVALILMAVVFIPGFGIVSGGAPRWIKFFGATFQPSEILKLTFIIYLATWLSNRVKAKSCKDDGWKFTLLPFFCILGFIFLLLYFQSNASTLGLIFGIAIVMYFLSGTPLWHTFVLFLTAVSGAVFMLSEPYRIKRVLVTFGMIKDPMGLGYQIKQSLITIGSGGIFGVGLGMSHQKFGKFLPQTMSDSIFAIFAEETGFIGCSILVLLLVVFFWRCIRIAIKSKDKFSQLFTIGVAVWFLIQAFINIGAMIQIFPLTGIPLPFISYGGSHIIVELIAIGIILNVSRRTDF
jgi:cell division protein FtsW